MHLSIYLSIYLSINLYGMLYDTEYTHSLSKLVRPRNAPGSRMVRGLKLRFLNITKQALNDTIDVTCEP